MNQQDWDNDPWQGATAGNLHSIAKPPPSTNASPSSISNASPSPSPPPTASLTSSSPTSTPSPSYWQDENERGEGNQAYRPNITASDSEAWLATLNQAQREAVLTTEGPLLVLAGAGTGKTRVLTTRLARILALGLAGPYQILCVTFTNKAAQEMRHRIESLLQNRTTDRMWIGTFHALAARIVRRHADLVGLSSNFTILDSDDQARLLKSLGEDLKIDSKRWPTGALAYHIERWKDRALLPHQVPAEDYQAVAGSRLDELYPAYQERMQSLNAVDFGDLLLLNIRLFTEHPSVYDDYRSRFRYILVDEYQDTNVAQYLWLRLLARPLYQGQIANLCCVGDDDQSIYGWRGAEIANILRFQDDFPQASLVRLECNYRSTPSILKAASHLISHNQGRLGKTLWTEKDEGEKVLIRPCLDDRDEAHYVASTIGAAMRAGDFNPKEIAVLVRAGFQTRAFEERFIASQIPYRVIGGLRFYEREETRDAIAWLRLVRDPRDELALLRIIAKPARGIGQTSLERIGLVARLQSKSVWEIAQQFLEAQELGGTARKGFSELFKLVAQWQSLNQGNNPALLAETVLEESGYLALWRESKRPDAAGRLENLQELLAALAEFPDLNSFLDHVSLVMDNETTQGGDYVSLMTLHAAKGLEFDLVYLPGWEEEIFPNARAIEGVTHDGLEEERRLAYVGLTRAKRQAVILYATRRLQYGDFKTNVPSRFLKELPSEAVQWLRNSYIPAPNPSPPYPPRTTSSYGQSAPTLRRNRPAAWRNGDRCQHKDFGPGTILRVDGQHIQVIFDQSGTRRMILADYLSKPSSP